MSSAAPAAVVGAMVNVFLFGDSPVFQVMVAGLLNCVAASLLMPVLQSTNGADELHARTRAGLIIVYVLAIMVILGAVRLVASRTLV
jgi:hypothetical protein